MKNKIYLISYYIIFILFILIAIVTIPTITLYQTSLIIIPIYILNIIITILFTILLLAKRKIIITNKEIYLNIFTIFFTIIITILALLMNKYVIHSMIHLEYYCELVVLPYIFTNIYSLLTFK